MLRGMVEWVVHIELVKMWKDYLWPDFGCVPNFAWNNWVMWLYRVKILGKDFETICRPTALQLSQSSSLVNFVLYWPWCYPNSRHPFWTKSLRKCGQNYWQARMSHLCSTKFASRVQTTKTHIPTSSCRKKHSTDFNRNLLMMDLHWCLSN